MCNIRARGCGGSPSKHRNPNPSTLAEDRPTARLGPLPLPQTAPGAKDPANRLQTPLSQAIGGGFEGESRGCRGSFGQRFA